MKSLNSLSKEELINLVEKQEKELKSKKYGLVWDSEREPEQVVLDCENHLPVLKRVEGKEIRTDDSEDNILIEGDNYHALTVLNYTHKEKIDVIYIDPPYNTGKNDEWKYNDRFIDENDGFRHSLWLNFLEKRLNIAYNLLKDDGVIFISIDDNELSQLTLLCDKILGEKNKLDRGIIIWNNAGSTKGFRNIVKNHEYILAYAKNFDNVKNYFGENFPKELGFVEDRLQIKRTKRNPICKLKFLKGTPIEGVKNVRFEKFVGGTTNMIDIINGPMEFKDGKLSNDVILEASFPYRYQVEKYFKNLSSGEKTYDLKGQEIIQIFFRKNGVPYYRKKRNIQVLGSVLNDLPNSGLRDLQKILPHVEFNNPKPVKLIVRLLSYFSAKKSLILDFFAGSGTTGHAVLEINKEDGGSRKFILCTNNEGNICTDVCYPRLSKVIKGYKKNGNGDSVQGLGGNLQYFKTSLIKKPKNRLQAKVDLTQKCTEMLCVKENIFNLKSSAQDYKIFESNKADKYLCIYYNIIEDSFSEFLYAIKELKGKKHIYMFSNDNKVEKSLFKGIKNISIEAIPQNILDVYKQLVKMNIPIKLDTIYLDFNKAKNKIYEVHDKDDAARLLRVVLEKLIQKLAQNNHINILNEQGKEIKISVLNDLLAKEKIIERLTWEENKTCLVIGNSAAHGNYDEYDFEQVKNFYKHIQYLFNKFDV